MKSTCSKCDNELPESRVGKQRYCNKCHAEWMRTYRPKHSELNEDQRLKANVRAYTKEYVKRGKIEKVPCEICSNPKVEAHHDDYSKPLQVKWLCRPCHMNVHSLMLQNGKPR